MEVQPDFKELLELFNENKVKYLIIGAYALAFYGSPRVTGDIDIWVEPTEKNAARILKALEAFGFGKIGITQEDFEKPDKVIQLGIP